YRKRAGCVVFNEAGDSVLLVNSRRHGAMTHTIPSGKVEGFDQSFEAAAVRETLEEAGVVCAVLGDLGWVKSHDKSGSPKATRVFYGRCDEVLDNWREERFRDRLWCSIPEALALLGDNRPLYQKAVTMAHEVYVSTLDLPKASSSSVATTASFCSSQN
ncbi:Diphosphoinositol polyphosphate phosphohydrolase, putative, partial [Perkinsus marinus ATCC 50983]